MKLSNYTIITLREIIIGDSGIRMPRQSGKQVTDLFNAFCIKKEIYPDDWIPTDKEVACSRKQYAEKRLRELNNTYQLSKLIERIVQPVYFEQHGLAYDKGSIDGINQLLAQDGYTIEQIEGVNKIVGATAPDEVKVQVHFEDIQSQILEQIDAAKYIIWLAMAWLTDLTLLRALDRRQKEGINVQIVVFDDEINQKWGVLQPHIAEHFSIYKIKYADSTKMHNKFCVIDLKIIIHGSYNWTDRARYNNETMEIGESRELACSFADEFIKLKQMASNH